MLSRIVLPATRLLLVLGMLAAGRADRVHAATPVGQDAQNVPSADKHPPDKLVTSPAKGEARKGGEAPGKPPAKTSAGKPLAGKPIGGDHKGADQKGRLPPPVAVIPPPLKPPEEPPPNQTGEPPPKLPRFAALKTDETNMRKGPGQRYPIDWVYQRRDLPMEVEREYDVWRLVRDPEGAQGWVHQVTLSDRRTFMIKDKDATLRGDADDKATPVALLKAGVIGRLRECDQGSKWCQVLVGGYKGYLRRDQIWGLLPDEVLAPS